MSIVGANVDELATGQSQSKGKESGVSRLSVGFRHLMDWGRESPRSIITESGRGQSIVGSGSNLESRLRYDMKAGEASNLPGGGFPRAEAAVITGFPQESMEQAGYSHTPTWFNKYVRHMEYLVAEQSGEFGHYDGTNASPGMPTRRWIYGIPSKRPSAHSAKDANKPIFEALLKVKTKIDSSDKTSEVNQIYTSIYMNMLASLNKIQPAEMENLIKFLRGTDEGLSAMGASMLKGLTKDPPFPGKVDEKVEELVASRYGGEKGKDNRDGLGAAKSRQEVLALLSKIGVVVTTGHSKLGGSEPMDVWFNKPHRIKFPDPKKGTNEITIKLADISEEDWSKPGHHGTGKGKKKVNTRAGIKEHYNDKTKGRIPVYNNLIRLIRKYVDMKTDEHLSGKGKGTKGAGKTDQTWDAWYRRRATQIASDIREGVKLKGPKARTGAGAHRRGQQDLLRLELMQFIADNEAVAAEGFMGVEHVDKETLKHVLHHMGNANAVYEGLNDDAQQMFPVNEYGEMISFDQADGEEWTVIINFRVNEKKGKNYGLVEDLRLKDIAIVEQSLSDIFISFWAQEGGLTDAQMREAWDLTTTVSGMSKFASYFAEQVGIATAIPGSEAKRWTVRADAAIPAYMDDLMYMFFHGGNELMKRGIADLLSDMDKIAKTFSGTLRTALWGKLRSRWPTYAWGSQNKKYGNVNTPRVHSDERHPPTALFHQSHYDINFEGRTFWPQQTPSGGKSGPQPFKEVPMDTQTGGRKRRDMRNPLSEEEFPRDSWGSLAKDMGLYQTKGKIMYGKTDMDALGLGRRYAGPKDRDREWKLPADPMSAWWRAAPVVWQPNSRVGENIPAQADSLDFVWAAPYVTWQHYQMSGSVK